MRDIRDKARQLVPSPERTAAKLAELFLSTSPDLYKPQGYRKMMSALLKWQRPNGLWGQLLNDPESYDETSATAMFAYAFAEGAKAGVLNGEYKAAVEKAYAALVARLDEYGNLPDVCVGTGWKNDRRHYLTRPRCIGDPHGQAPLLWLCGALMRAG